jgi:hypothetical protein
MGTNSFSLDDFAKYVAKAVLREDFEEDAGGWAELFCRRLYKLGYIDKADGLWVEKGADNDQTDAD